MIGCSSVDGQQGWSIVVLNSQANIQDISDYSRPIIEIQLCFQSCKSGGQFPQHLVTFQDLGMDSLYDV